jgi:beta-lactamase class D
MTLIDAGSVNGNGMEEKKDWGTYFKASGVDGTFLFYDLKSDRYSGYNLNRLESAYLPASTYKIINSLIALESGVIKDENETLKWDGVDRAVKDWNRDHNLRSAFKYSAVWFYQEMARRVGQERMQKYVDATAYGNRNIKGGIDHFWLDGELRITPRQQIDFLVSLYQNKVPFSQRNIDIVKDIFIFEKTDNYILRGKTGWAGFGEEGKTQIGWFVGYIEREGRPYFFAMNIDIKEPKDAQSRVAITKKILSEMKLID